MKTITEYYAEIEAIENNPRNVLGGMKALLSDRDTHLTAKAKHQIEAIERKISKLVDLCEDD